MATGGSRPPGPFDGEPVHRRRLLRISVGLLAIGASLLTAQVVLATAPHAGFTAPSTLHIGQSGTFTSTTPDPDDDGDSIDSIVWDFGDGSPTGSGTGVSHSYASAGQKTVTMTVTDSAAEVATATKTVNVVNMAPVPSLVAAPNPARPDQTVNFDASASHDPDPGGSIIRYEWDLDGNGTFETDTGTDPTTSHAPYPAGRRDIRLRVTDVDLGTASTTISLLVNTPPVAAFTALGGNPTPSVPDVGETVAFNGAGSTDAEGALKQYEWDLDGNGSFETDTGTTPSTVSTYATRGTRNVKLRVTDSLDQTATAIVALRINAKPVGKGVAAAVGAPPGVIPPPLPLIGQQVALASTSTDEESTNPPANNNTITTYQWVDSGGPFGGNNPAVIHPAFTTAGDKLIALRVTDSDGATSDAVVTVRINTPPVADFLFLPQTPLTNEAITFEDASSDPDPASLTNPANGLVAKSEWDLDGDGQFDDATGSSAQASFPTAGDHMVGLRVTDGGGATKTITKTVRVENTRPTAAFDASPAFPLPGQDVAFTSAATPTSGKTITTQEWDFDYDPATDTFAAGDVDAEGASASHAFAGPGQKLVGLKVTESGGGIDITTRTVTVNAPPQASFQAAPANPVSGDAVTFSSTSSDPDGPITQAWDTDDDGEFDDAAGSVASRTFAQAGSYTVRLRVTDDHGASAVHSGQINVAPRHAVAAGQQPGGPSAGGSALQVLDARVQIAGRITPRGTKHTLLRVRAPKGSRIAVRCRRGATHRATASRRACPLRSKTVTLHEGRVRFKRLERTLRPGVRITVTITKPGFVGRSVRFTIRKHTAPRRRDLCIQPGASRASGCPT